MLVIVSVVFFLNPESFRGSKLGWIAFAPGLPNRIRSSQLAQFFEQNSARPRFGRFEAQLAGVIVAQFAFRLPTKRKVMSLAGLSK